MNEWLVKTKRIDWEEFGLKTALECNEEVDAIEICGHHLHALDAQLQPELSSLSGRSRTIAITVMPCTSTFTTGLWP